MTFVRRCWLYLALTFCLAGATFAAPVTIFVVRHAEKVAGDGDLPLSEKGRARAKELARMLEPAGVRKIFSSPLQRARETAAPLAEQLKLEVEAREARDMTKLAAELSGLPAGAVVLVVGHSNTIPELVEKLGATRPPEIGEHDHDRLFIVIRNGASAVHVIELCYGTEHDGIKPRT